MGFFKADQNFSFAANPPHQQAAASVHIAFMRGVVFRVRVLLCQECVCCVSCIVYRVACVLSTKYDLCCVV